MTSSILKLLEKGCNHIPQILFCGFLLIGAYVHCENSFLSGLGWIISAILVLSIEPFVCVYRGRK